MIKMELSRVHMLLGAVGFLLWTSGGSAAPMECHFNFRGEMPYVIIFYIIMAFNTSILLKNSDF